MLISFVFTKKFSIIYLIVIICLTFKESLALNKRDTTERVNWACDHCRFNKKKCNSQQPCNRCFKNNKTCRYSSSKKRGRKTDKITYKNEEVPKNYLLTFHMNTDLKDDKMAINLSPEELANLDPENISTKNNDNDYYKENNHFYYLNEIYNLATNKY